ncbi:MAG TPA: XdhC/CoxI family protein [Anaerolineae bacterium]
MREVVPDIDRWRAQGDRIALATVIQTWGSAPRGVGAKMALTVDGKIAGSVSGGCVEGAVFEAGTQVIRSGEPQLLQFGVADETAWEVGLACGGSIRIFVQPLDSALYEAVHAALIDERAAVTITIVQGPTDRLGRQMMLRDDGSVAGSLGSELDPPALEAARTALSEGQSKHVPLGDVELFFDVTLPSPTLVAVGGVHIAIALASIAKALGYRTIVVDPRRAFGSEERFPHADQLIRAWPDEALVQIGLNRSTAVAMLTHDPKLDDPALIIALPSPAFYVGALGSRKTQAARRQRLQKAGLTQAQINRLRGPIGLNLGARTPEEIALSVMAEIVAARNGQI